MDHWTGVRHLDEARLRAAAPPPMRPRAPMDDARSALARAVDRLPREEEPDRPRGSATPEQLAQVAEHCVDGVVIYDAVGAILWVNEAFELLTGWAMEDVVGRDRLSLIRGPFVRTPRYAELAEELRGDTGVDVEFVTRRADGASYWTELTITPVLDGGEVVGRIGIERDVTQRRELQEHAKVSLRRAHSLINALRDERRLLSTVLETLPHLVWWKNEDLRFVGGNKAFLSFRGLGTPAELVGRLDEQLAECHGFREAVGQIEAEVVAEGRAVMNRTIHLPQDDGRSHTFLISVLPFRTEAEQGGLIGIGADVSLITELERQLAQASRLESIGSLAAGIAHEINTPVQYVSDNTRFVTDTFGDVIAGLHELADLIAELPADDAVGARMRQIIERLDLEFVADEVPSALTQAQEGLDRVAGIVRAMKDFSHPGRGRSPVDINAVISSTAAVSRSEWKYVAELELELDPDAGTVPCYEGELKQALLNIVVNAAHAIETRRAAEATEALGRLAIRTRRGPAEMVIRISDDGCGMTDAVRHRIFDPFFTTKDVGKGTGQGLSLAHATVVAKHGGRIEVESVPGQGTTFTLVLPLNVPAETETEHADPAIGR